MKANEFVRQWMSSGRDEEMERDAIRDLNLLLAPVRIEIAMLERDILALAKRRDALQVLVDGLDAMDPDKDDVDRIDPQRDYVGASEAERGGA